MRVKILSKKRVLDDFFKIDEIKLQHEKFNGDMSSPVRRLNFERGNSVGVLLKLTDTQQFVLVNQFRYAAYQRGQDGWIDEIIAGTFEKEKPEDCAYRETLEESGYQLQQRIPLSSFFASPGGTTEKIYLYLGLSSENKRNHRGGGVKDEYEDIQLKYYNEDELSELLRNNKLHDAKTIIAVQYYLLNRKELQKYEKTI